jgi:hypothetical protein
MLDWMTRCSELGAAPDARASGRGAGVEELKGCTHDADNLLRKVMPLDAHRQKGVVDSEQGVVPGSDL